jgi:hypothetical protein
VTAPEFAALMVKAREMLGEHCGALVILADIDTDDLGPQLAREWTGSNAAIIGLCDLYIHDVKYQRDRDHEERLRQKEKE